MEVSDQNPDLMISGGGLSRLALLLILGLHWITFAAVKVAAAAVATSRLLYHGRLDPQLQRGKPDVKQLKKFKILFLSTGNSSRSIFGEYLIKRICPKRFESYSGGTFPTGTVDPKEKLHGHNEHTVWN